MRPEIPNLVPLECNCRCESHQQCNSCILCSKDHNDIMDSILFDNPRVPRDAVFNMDEAGFVWSSRAQIPGKHVLKQCE